MTSVRPVPKIVVFTKKLDKLPLYVNADKVAAFDALPDGGTRLVFDEVFAYQIVESVQDVVKKLTHSH